MFSLAGVREFYTNKPLKTYIILAGVGSSRDDAKISSRGDTHCDVTKLLRIKHVFVHFGIVVIAVITYIIGHRESLDK